MYLKYYREFRSQDEVRYRVEILTTDSSMVAKEVQMPAESPVVIEWPETENKLEPVQGSRLELKLLSESDREFVDLYRVEAGAVRCDIYREGLRYWSGTLDTEFYEEPYATKDGYEVSLTFSDFAILERKKWNKTGQVTMREVLQSCIGSSGINITGYHTLNISTKPSAYDDWDMTKLWLTCDNFYDEDGEALSKLEVLEGVLRPFGLRIIQKGGHVRVYDLNAASGIEREDIYWKSSDQTLGTDKTYNDVTVMFSPYAEATIVDGSVDYDEISADMSGGILYYTDYSGDNIEGFKIDQKGDDGSRKISLPVLSSKQCAKFFCITAEYSGSDDAGVAWQFKGTVGNYYDDYMVGGQSQVFGKVYVNGNAYTGTGTDATVCIIKTGAGFISDIGDYYRDRYRLRIDLSLLADVRYNPFESSSKENESGNWDRLQNWSNYAYIPVMLRLKDAAGEVLYHYENDAVMQSSSYKQDGAGWKSGDGKWGCMWLAYYDWSDRKSKSGLGGWQQNRQIIGSYSGGLPALFEKRGNGEFIPLPPAGGWLELSIGRGLHQFDNDDRTERDIQSRLRWLLYKDPKITVVKRNGRDVELEDIEDVAWINADAKDNLEIETIIGTLGKGYVPSSRGLVMNETGEAYSTFYRAGVTDRLERLLIGTAYSQYAGRKAVLSGTARLIPGRITMTDASTDGMFLIVQETQNLYEGTSEVKMVEVSPDDYQGIEYK